MANDTDRECASATSSQNDANLKSDLLPVQSQPLAVSDNREAVALVSRLNEEEKSPPPGRIVSHPAQDAIRPFVPRRGKKFTSPISYLGSKNEFVDILAPYIPDGMLEYREPFFGGGNIYFNFADKLKAAGVKIWVNEIHRPLYCYWLKVRDDPETLWTNYRKIIDDCQGSVIKGKAVYRDLYQRMEASDEMEAAAAYAAANHMCRNSLMSISSFEERDFLMTKLRRKEAIATCHRQLQGVEITNLDFHDVIAREGDGVLLMMDPPYDDTAKLYIEGMNYGTFLEDLITTPHAWLVTHTMTWRHRGRMLWAKLMGRSGHFHQKYYEMGRGIGRTKKTPEEAPSLKKEPKVIKRYEVLITNYDPKSDIWAFWKRVAADNAKSENAPPLDFAEIARQIEAGEGVEVISSQDAAPQSCQ